MDIPETYPPGSVKSTTAKRLIDAAMPACIDCGDSGFHT